VIVHELAHQWTGDYLAVARWQDIWLNEGFATYSEWLWSENEGEATAQEIFDAVTSTPADDDFWSLTIGDPGPDHLFDSPIYDRGAATLHALRLKIGDDAFFRLLRRWVRKNAGGNVTTPQFIALAERVSGQDLGVFFDQWLFTPARPASLPPVATAARSTAGESAATARMDRRDRVLRALESRRR
jgi:aminopeptidase N